MLTDLRLEQNGTYDAISTTVANLSYTLEGVHARLSKAY